MQKSVKLETNTEPYWLFDRFRNTERKGLFRSRTMITGTTADWHVWFLNMDWYKLFLLKKKVAQTFFSLCYLKNLIFE